MIIVNTHEAKTKLSKLLAAIEDNQETVRICRNGKPIADLTPASKKVNPLQKHKALLGVKMLNSNKWTQ
ncbi:MAG: type II toxin-antitoxin system prevent-host-death family antitoxin [Gammaproteobacteria bacterium]|nr:type II toxin-antitoxin system prevent-host-death family antitoxin [Gammaproteobacteria bacterium]